MIQVFLSRPNKVPRHVANHLDKLTEILSEHGMEPQTIGPRRQPIESPFDEVVALMKTCQCSIILGLSQIHVTAGKMNGKEITDGLRLPSEWNHIEGAISVMLGKPTLMMCERGVADRGMFARGAANVFVHEFATWGPRWLEEAIPKIEALKAKVDA